MFRRNGEPGTTTKMKKLFKSLKNRIFVFCILIGCIIMLLMHLVVTNSYEYDLIDRCRTALRQQCSMLAADLAVDEDIQKVLASINQELLMWYSESYGGRILITDPSFRIVADTYAADLNRICISDAVLSAFGGTEYSHYNRDSGYLEFAMPLLYGEGENRTVTGVLVFTSTTDWINSSLRAVKNAMLLTEGILAVILVLIVIYSTYLLVRPIHDAAYEIEKMRDGNMNIRLEKIDTYNEINEILVTSSEVIRQYQDLEKSQEEFVSNVSHELRTPMTSVRVLSDSLIGQPGIPEEVYQEFLSDISVEIEREARIIDDLLSMTRLKKGSDVMNVKAANINDFVKDMLKTIRPIAEAAKVELIYESFRQISADIDEVKLNQALSNLIENGVKYNNEGGFVKVSLDADHEYFYVKVADNGVGIPEDAVEHVFDRFYRVDKARSRETGGTGLGLSITKTIVLLHNGVIKVESSLGKGTTFTVRIPLKYTQDGRG